MSPRALAATLPKVTKPVLEKHGRAFATLIAEWINIAGPELAAVSLPEKLVSGGRTPSGGTLTVRVAGAAATELQHVAPQIIERINTFLGFRSVTRLKLVQGPLPGAQPRSRRQPSAVPPAAKAAVAAAAAEITDPALRDALCRLGLSIATDEGPEAPAPWRPAARRP